MIFNQGLAYLKKMEFDLAINKFREILKIAPNNVEAHNSLGLAYQGKGKFDLAIQENKKALKIDPNYANAHFDLGMAYMETRPEEAIRCFQKFLTLCPYKDADVIKAKMATDAIQQLSKKTKDVTGNSIENAIVIEGVANGFMGAAKEYWYLTEMFGKQGVNWDLETQETMKMGDKQYDKMNIKLSDGTRKSIYFDITSFYGLYLSREG